MLMACAVVFALTSTQAFAATKTVKNLPKTTRISVAIKKATKVKKGTTTLKFKKGSGFGVLKFKAPKTKTYTFTLSNLTSSADYTFGAVEVGKTSGTTLKSTKVKIVGVGKRPAVPVESASVVDLCKAKGLTSYTTSDGITYKYLSKTSFRIKLKKGQTIVLVSQFMDQNQDPVAAKMKLKIK